MNANGRRNTRAKSHICPHDGKRFATRRGLDQHCCQVHAVPLRALPQRSARRGRGRGGAGDATFVGDIAPSRIPPPPGGNITISGEDRLLSRDVKKDAAVLQGLSIEPGMSARLATISKAYQRIKWLSVEVIVTPQASAITNGGYVCGFVMDPTDSHVTAEMLSATQGSVTKKWYETAIVRMPRKPDLLYTSDSEEPRLSEPARFWIISEGKPSSDLNIVVTCRWRVTLLNPSLEDRTSDSFVLVGDLRAKKDNYNMSYFPHCSQTAQDDFSSQIPDRLKSISGNHFFRVPTFSVEYNSGSEVLSDQMHYVVYKTSDKKAYWSSDGTQINTTSWSASADIQYLIPEGTYFKYVGMGNVCAAAVQGHRKLGSRILMDSSSRLDRMERLLNELSLSLRRNSRTLERRSRDSSLEWLEKPIQSDSSP